MSAYFSGFPTEKKRLAELLCMDDINLIPYKDIAYMVYNLRECPFDDGEAAEAVLLLATPIRYYYNRMRERNEESS